MTTYLMHRISHEGEKARTMLEKDQFLSIGWSLLNQVDNKEYGQELLDLAKNADKEVFKNRFVEIGKNIDNSWLTSRRGIYLFNFLSLKKEDIVVVPIWNTITICEVIENPIISEDTSVDIGFKVKVKIIAKDINRYDYVPQTLSSKFKYQGLNLILSDNDQEMINEIIHNFNHGIKIYNFGATKEKLIRTVHTFIQQALNENHFERLIKAYLLKIGADEVSIPAKNDKNTNNDKEADIDVKALFNNIGVCIYVQAKKHVGITDETGIKQLLKFNDENDETFSIYPKVKWLITTGQASDEVIEEAKKEDIRIIQNMDFSEMLLDAGISLSDDIFEKNL